MLRRSPLWMVGGCRWCSSPSQSTLAAQWQPSVCTLARGCVLRPAELGAARPHIDTGPGQRSTWTRPSRRAPGELHAEGQG